MVNEGGLKVIGEEIPIRLWVSMPHFTIFRNEKYFDRPHNFIPKRWIADESTGYSPENVKLSQTAFQPFSVGPRHCITRNLAVREITFALARIFYLFDVDPVPNSGRWMGSLPDIDTRGDNFIHEQWDIFTSLEKGPHVRVKVKDDVVSRL